ncbi:MAG: hypothetical protein BWY63_02670 [Chloroflexi bacterium ADurb.Bin360]|nr:MAG: hypothetical protein BWY63_02670 [Chloroflexi bacterium ADurb.Bin360]
MTEEDCREQRDATAWRCELKFAVRSQQMRLRWCEVPTALLSGKFLKVHYSGADIQSPLKRAGEGAGWGNLASPKTKRRLSCPDLLCARKAPDLSPVAGHRSLVIIPRWLIARRRSTSAGYSARCTQRPLYPAPKSEIPNHSRRFATPNNPNAASINGSPQAAPWAPKEATLTALGPAGSVPTGPWKVLSP